MTKRNSNFMPFFVLVFVIIVPAVLGGTMRQSACNDALIDGFMQERAHNATRAAIKAYNPHPELAVIRFSKEVHESMSGTNSTRRNLGGGGGGGGPGHGHGPGHGPGGGPGRGPGRGHGRGGCMATNPIDRCWRCNKNWAKNRQALAKCARGFGEHTIGGMNGRIYVVTDSSDNDVVTPKKGTLRYAVIQDEPLWIIFEQNMVIQLKEELMINNDKTIDGRGANVQIAYGAGLTMQFVHNIIVHGIHIHHIVPKSGGMVRDSLAHFGLRTASDGDGISIFGASKVWVDHVSLDHCADGLIDAIMASTALTISNCKFNYHNDVMLLGANDQFTGDEIMQVTVAFNRFGKGLVQRMPRCRWGFFHVVNNDYNKWEMYAIGGSMNPTIISQGNRFRASDNVHAKEVTHRDHFPFKMWKNWRWRTVNDLFLNGAFFVPSGDHSEVAKELRTHMVQAKDGSAVGRLTRYAGMLLCTQDKPC